MFSLLLFLIHAIQVLQIHEATRQHAVASEAIRAPFQLQDVPAMQFRIVGKLHQPHDGNPPFGFTLDLAGGLGGAEEPHAFTSDVSHSTM